jgi:glycosyltransferase involved in cell wall biosynthesis
MFISCIIPARNEAGHLRELIAAVLPFDEITDIIIVEGGSSDNTYGEAVLISEKYPDKIRVIKQNSVGKFNAVQSGVLIAREKLLLIWDADGTVPAKSTNLIIRKAIITGHTTIGDRLRGNREVGSMQFFNFLGNWAFALVWIPLLWRKPIDLLCGTKIIHAQVFAKIPNWLLKIDPYGDFSLIATARFFNFPIESVPVKYLARKYGETNIRRWNGGFRLLITTLAIYFWFIGKNKCIAMFKNLLNKKVFRG